MCHLTICHPVICPCRDPFCSQVRYLETLPLNRHSHIIGCQDWFATWLAYPCDLAKCIAYRARGLFVEPGARNKELWEFAIRYCPEFWPKVLGEATVAEEMCARCKRVCVQPGDPSKKRGRAKSV